MDIQEKSKVLELYINSCCILTQVLHLPDICIAQLIHASFTAVQSKHTLLHSLVLKQSKCMP